MSVDNCPSPKEKHERFSYTNANGVITLDGKVPAQMKKVLFGLGIVLIVVLCAK